MASGGAQYSILRLNSLPPNIIIFSRTYPSITYPLAFLSLLTLTAAQGSATLAPLCSLPRERGPQAFAPKILTKL